MAFIAMLVCRQHLHTSDLNSPSSQCHLMFPSFLIVEHCWNVRGNNGTLAKVQTGACKYLSNITVLHCNVIPTSYFHGRHTPLYNITVSLLLLYWKSFFASKWCAYIILNHIISQGPREHFISMYLHSVFFIRNLPKFYHKSFLIFCQNWQYKCW